MSRIIGIASVGTAVLAMAGVSLVKLQQTTLTSLTVILQSSNGSQTCPADSMSFNANVVTIGGLACPPDEIFKNGFEL